MPFEEGHKKSVGNKGGGRKSTRDEFAKNQAIKKAWEKVNKNVDEKDVEKIALPLALKDMVQKQEHSGEIEVKPLLGGMSNNNQQSGSDNTSDKQTTEAEEKA